MQGVEASNAEQRPTEAPPVDLQVTHLGYYSSEEAAARVYDKVAITLHADRAQTNFPADQVGLPAKLSLLLSFGMPYERYPPGNPGTCLAACAGHPWPACGGGACL